MGGKKNCTSSSGAMGRRAMTCMSGSCVGGVLGERGNTMTAFGSQEWLIRAMSGEIETPSGVKEGVEIVNAFVMN